MNHQTGELELPTGEAEGAKLYWQAWLPDSSARAVIMLVHGYAEHSGRYEHVAAHCVARGYAVYALDHWGHGRSEGERGFIPAFSVLLDGVEAFHDLVRSEQPAPPMVLLGHSMGGLISTLHLAAHGDRYAAAVLSAPAVTVAEPPSPIRLRLAGLLSRVAPRTGILPQVADGVSRDPAVVAAYEADPLVYHGKVGARMGFELLGAMANVEGEAPKITLPILIMHGDQDVLASVEGSKLLDARITSEDKKLIVYPGLHHEIFNEPEQEQVLDDMTGWLEGRLP